MNLQERKSALLHCTAVAGWAARLSMDILAAILAYLVCAAGVVGGLVLSFVIVFTPPALAPDRSQHATAMLATPRVVTVAQAPAARPQAVVKTIAERTAPTAADSTPDKKTVAESAAAAPPIVAADARQRPLFSRNRLRQMAERERARHLAYRERSSFETRFLHFED